MQEQLHGQTNAGNPNKEDFSETIEKLIEREKIEGTPFYIIGNKEEGYFLSFGKHRITELMKTPDDVIQHVEDNHWDITLKVILAVVGEKEQITK